MMGQSQEALPKDFRKTSTGEKISEAEFQRRRKETGYCCDCGAKIRKNPLVDRCSECSSNYARDYYESGPYLGKSGMPGGE